MLRNRVFFSALLFSYALILASNADADTHSPHKWWRVLAPGETKWALAEVRWSAVDGSFLSGGTFSSSGDHAEWSSAVQATDANDKTYWCESTKTESENRWLGVQFDHATSVVAVEIKQYPHDNYKSFYAELQYSDDDGHTWTTSESGDLSGEQMDDGSPVWERIPPDEKYEQLNFF